MNGEKTVKFKKVEQHSPGDFKWIDPKRKNGLAICNTQVAKYISKLNRN